MVTEKGKSRILRGQLRDVLDLNVLTSYGRRGVPLDLRKHGIIELGGRDLPMSILIH